MSVVICTHNRAALLPRVVRSVFAAAQNVDGADVELVLVDNASSDDTLEVAQALGAEAPIPLRVVSAPDLGVCRAKNKGIAAASGEVIAFTDDDCELAPDYLVCLLRHFGPRPGPMIRGGRVALGDPADLPFTIKEDASTEVFDGKRHPGGFVHGCNLAVSRSALEIVGGFDESFGPGATFRAAEDTDLVYRAHKKNIPIIYTPDMLVYHFHGRRSMAEVTKLNRAYQFGNGALHLKNGLADRLLARNLYWNVRGYTRELTGGDKFDATLGISYREIVLPQLAGMWSYFLYLLSGRRR